jgi:chemotaxis protein MotB
VARKKKHPEHVNHERWLVSYADFITLLFAFFVVMFAVSQVDSKKLGRFSESFEKALESNAFNAKGKGLLPSDKPRPKTTGPDMKLDVKKLGVFNGEKQAIRASLAARAQTARVLTGLRILDIHGELVLRLPERLIFPVGDATIQDDGRIALQLIADEVAERHVRLRVEGHTDNAPIRTARFPSNWELSTARATSVVAFLVDTKKIDPTRLSAAGYGQYHPIAENDTVDGRAQNRRVDIVVVTDEVPQDDDGAGSSAPPPAAPPPPPDPATIDLPTTGDKEPSQ